MIWIDCQNFKNKNIDPYYKQTRDTHSTIDSLNVQYNPNIQKIISRVNQVYTLCMEPIIQKYNPIMNFLLDRYFFFFFYLNIWFFYLKQIQEATYSRLCNNTKNILTVNGLYPGPTISAHKGDIVYVKVINRGNKNITMHWYIE